MKRAIALLVAMGAVALASPQEAQAQFYRGGSGFAISVGNGFGGFGPGFGGFGPVHGFGGYGFRPAGVSIGYSSFRPSYGYGGYGRSFHGGYGGYRGGYGRSCRGW